MTPHLPRGLGLPDFPWDLLDPARALAASHPDGACDLSVGTPVDPTPGSIRDALAQAADAPGYPTVVGTAAVREAILAWGRRRRMVDVGPAGVLPTIGSKEAVAWIPRLLGVGPADTVLVPEVAYSTYDIGARLAGAAPVPVDPRRPDDWPDAALVYLNTPGNPDGHVLSVEELRAAVSWARERGAVVVSDECYAALPWQAPWVDEGVPSLLDARACDGDPAGLLVLYSLSKQSNLAGYRAGLVYGDPRLVAAIVEARKHAGLMVPAPVQHAMAAALMDEEHVAVQRETYRRRRRRLLEAAEAAGFVNDPLSCAGLYLWLHQPGVDDSWELVDRFARLGILVAPGDFYGAAARGRVRVALTASDERIDAAARRLEARWGTGS
ncbi:succinyldiaminopimelate transaminase [Actinomyces sp. B33]|uniref:succinyldiaminopimelate transaminase n=1 Tax=Actinomyces sp. B33 TaxID=2942131 RepID=UPI002340346A|nr:succinyldiaminopimelate transaminase [Actinomyces sp. B33]MDC4232617.1 succinyldiaminopimelate transaminase [Actinomyces sp. B33]